MSMSSHSVEPTLNATPLIDVLLVLLVMLIFTIPVMTHKTALTMPTIGLPDHPQPESVALDIDFDGAVFWNGEAVASIPALEQRLKAAHARNGEIRIDVRPDARAPYEVAAQVMAATQRSRIDRMTIRQIPDR